MNVVVAVLAGLGILAASGLPALFLARGSDAGDRLSNVLLLIGAALASVGAALVLVNGPVAATGQAWAGTMGVRIDAIGAIFLLQTLLVAATGSVYGLAYWPAHAHPTGARQLRLFYGMTAAGLGLVFIAADAIVFLIGWEIMALSCFLALTSDDREEEVRRAGRLYLFCTRLGTLSLIAMFLVWREVAGSFVLAPVPGASTGVFVLALVGFGLKAGMMPLHVWLPGAHASAPSHLSALMSGVLIKSGIYGLIRILGLFGDPPLWWGATVFAFGVTSSVLGVVFAIGQHDIKRLLAYHSIENIGIILIGVSLALVGRTEGSTFLVTVGLAAALLHTWNHGLFKSLLFLSAGSVIHATGLRDLDRMGGLARRMPSTSLAFLVGATAISGLPPLNGFVSEFLLYSALLHALVAPRTDTWMFGALGTAALAITGALALLCFAKAYGVAFLGEPRSVAAAGAQSAPREMVAPMSVLVVACVFVALAPPAVAPVLDAAIACWRGEGAPRLAEQVPLMALSWLSLATFVLIAALARSSRVFAIAAKSRRAVTWDCGYAAPSPRMQSTASSFGGQIVSLFASILLPIATRTVDASPFPGPAHFHSRVRDPAFDLLLVPGSRGAGRLLSGLHRLQPASLHMGLLYIVLAILVAFSVS